MPERPDESWVLDAGGTAEGSVLVLVLPLRRRWQRRQALTEGGKAMRMSPALIETERSDSLRLAALGTSPLRGRTTDQGPESGGA